jgi:tetratricopeptide (TPR) repeat protein
MSTQTSADVKGKTPIRGTSLDDVLVQSGMDGALSAHKNKIIAAIAVLVIGVFGYGIYSQSVEAKNQASAKVVFDFTKGDYKKFQEGSLSVDQVLASYNTVKSSVGNFSGLTPISIGIADSLYEQGKNEEALKVLSEVSYGSNPYLHFFVSTRKAAIYEDQGKLAEAKNELEGLLKDSVKLMEDKIYLDLGRLWLALGDQQKAKTHFEYLTSGKGTFQAEFVKLARLYLANMGIVSAQK